MADISTLMNYDKVFPVALKNLVTGDELGITFNVVSINSARAVAAAREYEKWVLAEKAQGREVDEVDAREGISRARITAVIDSWDWGQHSFGDLGSAPECTEENKKHVINHPNADWIRAQLVMGCADIENFMSELRKPARTSSKKK